MGRCVTFQLMANPSRCPTWLKCTPQRGRHTLHTKRTFSRTFHIEWCDMNGRNQTITNEVWKETSSNRFLNLHTSTSKQRILDHPPETHHHTFHRLGFIYKFQDAIDRVIFRGNYISISFEILGKTFEIRPTCNCEESSYWNLRRVDTDLHHHIKITVTHQFLYGTGNYWHVKSNWNHLMHFPRSFCNLASSRCFSSVCVEMYQMTLQLLPQIVAWLIKGFTYGFPYPTLIFSMAGHYRVKAELGRCWARSNDTCI